jgi:hypothetical protein
MKSKPVMFTPPKDAAMPEDMESDESFDMVCSFKLMDGMCCMTKFGDADMPCNGDKKETPKEDKPGYGDMASGMMSTMES